ncbi:MAG TPA: Slp family lipoprotein [Nitrospira sp.]|nr:Slp family lipoprotein [Nitrospira sp.]
MEHITNAPHFARQVRRFSVLLPLAAAAFALLAPACSGSKVIPTELKEQIDSSVSFRDIQASPQALQGRTVLLGGEVLGARRVQEGVELEVLQLPVKDDDPPAERRTESQGRFLAIDRAAGDPASFPPGTKITLVGAVAGEETRRLDESTYRYPLVEVKHLYVWSDDSYRERSRSSVGLFGGMGFGFGSGGRGGSFGGVGIGTGF